MMKHLRAVVWVMMPMAVLAAVSACVSSRPRQRPIEGGAVDAGPGSLASVRKQLEGTWELVSAELVSPAGARTPLKAKATLTYDSYGNLSLKGAFDDPAATAEQTSVLNFTGRAVVDVQKQVMHLLDLQQSEGDYAKLPPEIVARRDREYAFEGDLLKLTVKDPAGRATAVNTWRRQAK